MTARPDNSRPSGSAPRDVAAEAEASAARQGVVAAVKVAEFAAANNWPREVTVEMLRALGLIKVPVVARVLARHGLL